MSLVSRQIGPILSRPQLGVSRYFRRGVVASIVFGWLAHRGAASADAPNALAGSTEGQSRTSSGSVAAAVDSRPGGPEHAPRLAPEPPKATPTDDRWAFLRGIRFSGYAEGFYQWNFDRPSNDITNYRAFDNRHNTFTLANVALGVEWDIHNVVGKITLQYGLTPSSYYLLEPSLAGSSGVAESNASLWKYIQEAYGGYRIPVGRGLQLQMGVFLSAVGVESIPVHGNWNWSNSNVFFGLPFYYTGLRASYPIGQRWNASLAVYNGWNSVVDNNRGKSLESRIWYTKGADIAFHALYFSGIERNPGSAEGSHWRHLFNMYGTWRLTKELSLRADLYSGLEPTRFGTSWWSSGAFYGRIQVWNPIFLALRIDAYYEYRAANDRGTATPISWPVNWVGSFTATLEYRPADFVSFVMEARHDRATEEIYYRGKVAGNGKDVAYVPNSRQQTTLTFGVTTWF